MSGEGGVGRRPCLRAQQSVPIGTLALALSRWSFEFYVFFGFVMKRVEFELVK